MSASAPAGTACAPRKLVTTRIGRYTYYVEVHGRAQQPRLELRSEPPLTEGDIVASLVFFSVAVATTYLVRHVWAGF